MTHLNEAQVLPCSICGMEGDVPFVSFHFVLGSFDKTYIHPGFIRSEGIVTEKRQSDGKEIKYAIKIEKLHGVISHSVKILQ